MVAAKGAYFLDGLKDLQKRWPQIGDVDGLGLALRGEICEADGYTPNKPLLDRMETEAHEGRPPGGRQAATASSSTSAATTRTSSPSRRRWTSRTTRSTWR